MAGHFSDDEEAQCKHYARFASHLGRTSFDIIYWFLFLLVIIMLFAASWRYGRSVGSGGETSTPEHERRMRRCMYECAFYATVSVVAVVMEVFALLALQFCDGEDLMALYWSTWTVMQVGALIAIFGILLAVFHTIRGREHPPWALALGTPVLVVAGLGHAVQAAMAKRVKEARSRSISRRRGSLNSDVGMSREGTLRVDECERADAEYNAKLVGYTPDGAPIIEFCDIPAQLSPAHGHVLGEGTNGQVIVSFRKDMTTLVRSSAPQEKAPESPAKPAPGRLVISVPSRSPEP